MRLAALIQLLVAFGAALVTPRAAAEETAATGDASGSARPAIRVELREPLRDASYLHVRGDGLRGPRNPDVRVPVGLDTLAAYTLLVDGQFRLAQGAAADAVLTVEGLDASVASDAAGWRAVVKHEVSLRTSRGEELGRWSVVGEERVADGLIGELPRAFGRACRVAAMRLGIVLRETPAAVAWLDAHGGGAAPAAPPPAFEPMGWMEMMARAFGSEGPPRPRSLLYLEGGLLYDWAEQGGVGAGLRVGVERAPFHAALGFGASWLDGQRADRRSMAVAAQVLGAEVGPVLRLGRSAQLRASVGLAHLWAEADGGSAGRFVGSFAVAGLFAAPPGSKSAGLRLGVELRQYVNGTVAVPRPAGSPATTIEPLGLSLMVLAGYEFAAGTSRAPTASP